MAAQTGPTTNHKINGNGEIYCYGDLLNTIQMAKLFEDSKTFVDMKLKQTPAKTLADFELLMEAKNRTPSREDLQKFVDYNAEEFGGHGGGGEYGVQTGFGWSNGVIIEWLSKHGRELSEGYVGGGAGEEPQ
ncbi:GL10148 [Drosophila persimilis]|uniref:Trehalase n=1 Tax=Drosophila persimilis TaxID=7234 RepID=B4H4X4_DROPE|nr:GL10148 [Drosophila persimilis]